MQRTIRPYCFDSLYPAWLLRERTTLVSSRIESTFSVRHYYNDILLTKWPFRVSMSILSLILGILCFFSKFVFGIYLVLLYMVALCCYLFMWFHEVYLEARILGKHTKKIKSAMFCGFFLFLCSEATLFAGFFWYMLDRTFASSSFIGFSSMPSGLERIVWYREPLRATLLLLASGYMANLSYYYLRAGSYLYSSLWHRLSILLGLLFLFVQYREYNHLHADISDSVCYSCMYLLTGFHGLHVIVGLLFLSFRDVDSIDELYDYIFFVPLPKISEITWYVWENYIKFIWENYIKFIWENYIKFIWENYIKFVWENYINYIKVPFIIIVFFYLTYIYS